MEHCLQPKITPLIKRLQLSKNLTSRLRKLEAEHKSLYLHSKSDTRDRITSISQLRVQKSTNFTLVYINIV